MRALNKLDFTMDQLDKLTPEGRDIVVPALTAINQLIEEVNYQRERRIALERKLADHGIHLDFPKEGHL